ncbi:hypothetical protein MAF45_03680 [Mesosutterella sp. OilRF-GAM-744-9]|uniref:Uncharacterized protein n=1 Tax=Mesosutterella porci TaxID=2915351 RepID=A0ABS9MPL5_9BURK|nr:hypothetical protein [Mesosutterella sp. oilRF-744-WT-GAM-9]MCG5030545.1 hypothetical protein [Mesosutterella sp. oilRF-744-WT-GAM-9]
MKIERGLSPLKPLFLLFSPEKGGFFRKALQPGELAAGAFRALRPPFPWERHQPSAIFKPDFGLLTGLSKLSANFSSRSEDPTGAAAMSEFEHESRQEQIDFEDDEDDEVDEGEEISWFDDDDDEAEGAASFASIG